MKILTMLVLFACVPAAAAAQSMSPGLWETTSRTTDFDMQLPPGVPAGMMDMVKQQMSSRSHSMQQCITRADLEEAPEKLFQESDGQCRYERFSMEGGELDAVANCRMQGMSMKMEMSGSYTPTTYDSRVVLQGSGDMGPVTMTMEGEGRRIGDC